MNQTLAAAPSDPDATNRRARAHALAKAADYQVEVTGLVTYSSAGRLLVIGDDPEAVALAVAGAEPLKPAALILGGAGAVLDGMTTWRASPESVRLVGWLGDFRLQLPEQSAGEERFDLVLDLSVSPLLESELPPPGYRHAGTDRDTVEAALDELRDLVGEFEKPRYFNYDPDICAHGMKGATACRRCIDACPADAIVSLVDRVQVEPSLCQGGGACATACPTGAMSYSYPSVEDLLERLRKLLGAYQDAGGEGPVLLIHDTGAGAERVDSLIADLGTATGHLLPLAVEEVASLGLEAWMNALAYGARGVRLVGTPGIPASARRELMEQLGFARSILVGLGYPENALAWLDDLDDPITPVMPTIRPSKQAAVGGKRQLFYAALDHLYAESERSRPLVELPAGAPFGTAAVDEKACTLCMACVTVCPGKALQDGQDVPQLKFLEANCVQCGLCTRSCPEDAIWISPRVLFDAERRGRPRLLREDSPFHCVTCGAAFATTAVIGRMQQRLAGHSMFKGERKKSRLQMCADCRVADMMRQQEL